MAVETQRGVGGAGAGDLEQAVADVQAVASRGHFGRTDCQGQVAAFFSGEGVFLGPGSVQLVGRAIS